MPKRTSRPTVPAGVTPSHTSQWEATLATYAGPIIGFLPVQVIDTALIMRVLEQEVCACSTLDGEA